MAAQTCGACGAILVLGVDPEQAALGAEESERSISLAEIVIAQEPEPPAPAPAAEKSPGALKLRGGPSPTDPVPRPEVDPLPAPASAPASAPAPRSLVEEPPRAAQVASRLPDPALPLVEVVGAGLPSVASPRTDQPPQACPVCNAVLGPGVQFCGNCGARIALFPERRLRSAPVALRASTAPQARARASLVLIHGDGEDGATHPLRALEHLVGRTEGVILFPEDDYLSPRHALFFYRSNRLYVRDEGSRNGIFLRIRGPIELADQDLILAGEELLRFERLVPPIPTPEPDGTFFCSSPSPRGTFRLVQLQEGGREGLIYCARTNVIVIGRENADINFPLDRFLSRHHSRVERVGDSFLLADLGSKNGTYLRLRGERELQHNDFLFLGKNLLRVDLPRA